MRFVSIKSAEQLDLQALHPRSGAGLFDNARRLSTSFAASCWSVGLLCPKGRRGCARNTSVAAGTAYRCALAADNSRARGTDRGLA